MTEAQRKDLEAMKAWNQKCERIIQEWKEAGCVGHYALPNAPKPPDTAPNLEWGCHKFTYTKEQLEALRAAYRDNGGSMAKVLRAATLFWPEADYETAIDIALLLERHP